ncbi:MAG: T9SS type A sorting domain-containing protein [Ginsengibacter sp.]
MGSFPVTQKLGLGVTAPEVFATSSPNPMVKDNKIRYQLDADANVRIAVTNSLGQSVKVLANQKQAAGTHTIDWKAGNITKGIYFIQLFKNNELKQTIKVVKE